MLPGSIAFEGVQLIAGRHLEIRDLQRRVDGLELAQRTAGDVGRHFLSLTGAEQLLGLPISEGLDHTQNVTRNVTHVNAVWGI